VDLSWSEHAATLHEAAVDFGRSLNEDLAERDAAAQPDLAAWRRCAEFGALGLAVPETYGGLAEELPTVVYALEGLLLDPATGGMSGQAEPARREFADQEEWLREVQALRDRGPTV